MRTSTYYKIFFIIKCPWKNRLDRPYHKDKVTLTPTQNLIPSILYPSTISKQSNKHNKLVSALTQIRN